MNASEFLQEIKNIVPDFNLEDGFFRIEEDGNEILFKSRAEDHSLYCDIMYCDILYYFNFNPSFEDHLRVDFNGEAVRLEVVEDLFEKIDAILNDKKFDTRVIIQIDIEEDVLKLIYENAHKMDITVNQYVEHLLREYIKNIGA